MILPRVSWRDDAALAAIIDALGGSDAEIRVVGGAVRDTLLDLPVADLDLATVHAPEETRKRIEHAGFKAIPTGLAHGTITAVLPSRAIEVTTLRRDVDTDGRHATVAFTDDWREDAARRDFTINAMSADVRGGRIFDYFDGLSDLECRRVRFIGSPLDRIGEDHLRILRFFRFHARFGAGDPDPEALQACVVRANDLMALSRERIAQELLKLLAVPDPLPTVRVMAESGIFIPVLPEIGPFGVGALARLVALDRADPDPVRRLAALLPKDAVRADQISARLKLSKAQRKRIGIAVDPSPSPDPRAMAYRIGMQGARDRLLIGGDVAGLARLKDWDCPRLPASGGDLIAAGLTSGPIVAATLTRVEQRWIDEAFPTGERVHEIIAEEVAKAR